MFCSQNLVSSELAFQTSEMDINIELVVTSISNYDPDSLLPALHVMQLCMVDICNQKHRNNVLFCAD